MGLGPTARKKRLSIDPVPSFDVPPTPACRCTVDEQIRSQRAESCVVTTIVGSGLGNPLRSHDPLIVNNRGIFNPFLRWDAEYFGLVGSLRCSGD